MNEQLSSDHVLGSWLKDLLSLEVFSAQKELENRILASAFSKLQSLSLDDPNLALEYVRVRSQIDAMKQLQNTRQRLIDDRNNHRSPA